MAGSHHAFVLTRDWLGEPKPLDRDRALAELARRYLAGHGPASDRDLARWAGVPLRDARAGLQAIAAELDQRDDGLVDPRGRPPAAELPPPRLLGAFEPLLLGWTSRDQLLAEHHRRLVTDNGLFRPFALVGGRAVATWSMPAGQVVLTPLEPIAPRVAKALQADATDVVRFLGAEPVSPLGVNPPAARSSPPRVRSARRRPGGPAPSAGRTSRRAARR
jgi:hypothetical protein